MSQYKALKSTDAEIILDIDKGVINFDYSFNDFGNQFNSNSSCILSNNKTVAKKIFDVFFQYVEIFVVVFSLTVLSIMGIIIAVFPKYQFFYQKAERLYWEFIKGKEIQTKIGELREPKFSIWISNNIWFDYSLEGEYQEKIKKVSLLRHFTIKNHLGSFQHIQSGWDVIFEFKDLPKNGSCTVRSLY